MTKPKSKAPRARQRAMSRALFRALYPAYGFATARCDTRQSAEDAREIGDLRTLGDVLDSLQDPGRRLED